MANGAPSQDSVLASLGAAADAARQAYLAAMAANPGADLSQLYLKEMAAYQAWADAEAKALNQNADAAALASAQAALDNATQVIRSELATIKNIATWLSLLDNLVQLAAKVAPFFV
jgi:hypothetical protein